MTRTRSRTRIDWYGQIRGEGSIPCQRIGTGEGEWLFINPDLNVHLARYPTDEWVCIDARSQIEPSGIGMAGATIRDRTGIIGRSSQSLLIAPR